MGGGLPNSVDGYQHVSKPKTSTTSRHLSPFQPYVPQPAAREFDAFLPPHIVLGRVTTNASVIQSINLMHGELVYAHIRAALLRVEDDEREFRRCVTEDYGRSWMSLSSEFELLQRELEGEQRRRHEWLREIEQERHQTMLASRRAGELREREEERRLTEQRIAEQKRSDEQQRLSEEERLRSRRAQDILDEHDRRVRQGEEARRETIEEIETDRSQVIFERKIHRMEVQSGVHRGGVIEVPYEFEVYSSAMRESTREASARRRRNEDRKQKALLAAQSAADSKLRALQSRSPVREQPPRWHETGRFSDQNRLYDYKPSPRGSRTSQAARGSGRVAASAFADRSGPVSPQLGVVDVSPIVGPTSAAELSAARRRRSAERRPSSPTSSIDQSFYSRKSVRFSDRALEILPHDERSSSHHPPPHSDFQRRLLAPSPPSSSTGRHTPDRRRAKGAFMSSVLSQ